MQWSAPTNPASTKGYCNPILIVKNGTLHWNNIEMDVGVIIYMKTNSRLWGGSTFSSPTWCGCNIPFLRMWKCHGPHQGVHLVVSMEMLLLLLFSSICNPYIHYPSLTGTLVTMPYMSYKTHHCLGCDPYNKQTNIYTIKV